VPVPVLHHDLTHAIVEAAKALGGSDQFSSVRQD